MTDISREAVEQMRKGLMFRHRSDCKTIGVDFKECTSTALDAAYMLSALRDALDAAEARERKAVEGVPHLRDTEGHWGDFVLSALNEAEKAMRKFPQPNYVISKVAEEAGEVVKASIHCAEGRETAENVRGEMRQLIAMLYRLWVEGDQVHGLPPVSAAIRTGARHD